MKKTVLLFISLLLLSLGFRISFYILYFTDHSSPDIIRSFYWGLQSDYTFLFLLNLPVWLYLLFINHKWRYARWLDIAAFSVFFLINFLFFFINFVDLFYYHFTLRRSTVDLLYVVKDSRHALVGYLDSYKLSITIFFVALLLLFFVTKKIFFSKNMYFVLEKSSKQWYVKLAFLIITFLLARGAGPKPFVPVSLFLHLPPQLQPLASNSGFSFAYSVLKDQSLLEEKHFFSTQELNKIFPLERKYADADSFTKKNVVVFILESFSKELCYPFSKKKAYMPFLDSIMSRSIFCPNSYANAFESNKGIVAILGGLPTFLSEPYYYSVYASNKIDGIGHLLSREGYETSFFMGANYDHFGFAKWCNMIGIKNYYSMEDYNNKDHFDGRWGISDHYFLPYAAKILKQQQTPFFATIFNLSSHAPFIIPKEVAQHFSIPRQNPQQNAVSYVDYSLRSFFDAIKYEPWYANTIFVFTADHCYFYDQNPGIIEFTEIPIFFHIPTAERIVINKPVQQIDIVPTIFDLLDYQKSFYTFGHSVFDTASSYAYFKFFDNYCIRDSSLLLSLPEKTNAATQLYNLNDDRSLKRNLINNDSLTTQQKTMERHLKAFIQRYCNTLIKNEFAK